MKILKLEFQNINSIKTTVPVVIDFDRDIFSQAGLFAITGPTGAGKTTILDAITIALYRQVPRFHASHIKLGLQDTVSRGAAEAMSRVTFSNNGKIYEAFWSIRIKSKSGRTLGKPIETVRLKDLSGNKIIAEKPGDYTKKTEEITQLTYEQFLRSMMLAQGEFAAFLKANKKEKVDLLDRIIGNDIYKRIGEAIAARVKTEEDNLAQIRLKINEQDLLSGERRKEFENEKIEILSQLEILKKEEREIRNVLAWYVKEEELKQRAENLETEKKELTAAYERHKNILDLLQLHLKAEPFEKTFHRLKSTEKEITDKELLIKGFEPQLKELQLRKERMTIRLAEVERKLKAAKEIQNHWLPKLETVTKLESVINSLKESVKSVDAEIVSAEKSIEDDKKAVSVRVGRKSDLKARLNAIDGYLSENSSVPGMEKYFDEWALKLHRREEKDKLLASLQNEIGVLTGTIDKLAAETGKKQLVIEQKELQVEKLSTKVKETEKKLAEYNVEKLTEDNQKIADYKERLANAVSISAAVVEKEKEKNILTEQIAEQEKIAEKLTDEITKVKTERASVLELLKEIERVFELENKVKSLEDERKKLKKGLPCPLCGSTEHPFVEKYEGFDFSETEKRLNEKRQLLENLNNLLSFKENELTKVKTNILNGKANLKKITGEIAVLEDDYKRLSIDIPVVETEKLKGEFETKVKELELIRRKMEQAHQLQKSLDTENSELQRDKEVLFRLKESLSVLKTKKDNAQKNITEKRAKADELSAEIKLLEQQLKDELTLFDLQLPGAEQTADFVRSLRGTISQYNSKKEEKIDIENKLKVLISEIEGLQKGIAEKENILTGKKREKVEKELQIKEKQAARNEILPGSITTQQKRSRLSEDIAKAEQGLNAVREEFSNIDKQMEGKRSEKTALEKEVVKLRETASSLKSTLTAQLEQSGFSGISDLERALLDYDTKREYLNISEKLVKKRTEIAAAEKEIAAGRSKLNETHTFDISREEAQTKLDELEKQQDKHNRRMGEISIIFLKDKELREKNRLVLKEIEEQQKTVDKWRKLFALTGGTKDAFNIYVQRLTLKSLINHANLHLSQLNDRYSLRLADLDSAGKGTNKELNIELIDHFQTDAVRAVETCSGGESFLLSLSLALGLSDLASRNVKVESLFIDEGFGTLDDDLLETVISTLETLHGSGKLIGVISHVEKLKERIPVQIQVEKTGNGVSRILIST